MFVSVDRLQNLRAAVLKDNPPARSDSVLAMKLFRMALREKGTDWENAAFDRCFASLTLREQRNERPAPAPAPTPSAPIIAEYNEDAGTIIINEWHSDCGPPFYIVPVREAIKFAKWLAQTRIEQQRQARRVSELLFTSEDKKRRRAAYRKWERDNPVKKAA